VNAAATAMFLTQHLMPVLDAWWPTREQAAREVRAQNLSQRPFVRRQGYWGSAVGEMRAAGESAGKIRKFLGDRRRPQKSR
jgi:hypothetical protein